jgi:hypothetical protein
VGVGVIVTVRAGGVADRVAVAAAVSVGRVAGGCRAEEQNRNEQNRGNLHSAPFANRADYIKGGEENLFTAKAQRTKRAFIKGILVFFAPLR